jgi:starch-binding outer membrane protein, SusD/RagB family
LHMTFTPRYDFHEGVKLNTADDVGFQRYASSKRLLTLFNDTVDQRYAGSFKEVWYANDVRDNIRYTEMKGGDTAIYWSNNVLTAAYKQARAKRFEILDINDLFHADGSLKDNRNFIEMHKFADATRAGTFVWRSRRDAFVLRISEMYLVVAEAAMQSSNLPEAVTYMNGLRTKRAKPGRESGMQVSAADLNIDFILDERARELVGEQLRWFDLKRTNKLVEYVRKYNPEAAPNIQPYHLLRPIPQSQLDAVTNKSEFTQNPGYH